jgi:hypothetical protein
MKIHALALFILAGSYYTFTYGKSLWVEDKNKLAGFGAALVAVLAIIVPAIFLFFRNQ